VLERKADNNVALNDWHQMVRQGNLAAAFKDVTLTYFDSSGQATVRLVLVNAWPSEYRLTQKGGELVEEVTLTADGFIRQPPQ
jgi:T4-like virus tail tube protein gp19